jgi:16S rRNA (guanine(1405)-N(7))-methyltransferase
MVDSDNERLSRLVDAVLASPKYRSVCRDFVRNVGARELDKRHSLKEAIKETKNRLHLVGGAFLDGEAQYAGWLDALRAARHNRKSFADTCAEIMRYQSSTRERLEILDSFYATLLAHLPPIHSVLDIACGLNPLSIPWMPLAEDAEYHAYDVYQDMMAFLDEFMAICGVRGHVHTCDVLQYCPPHHVDVAFMLKALPCLEQVDKSAVPRLLEAISADHLVVSFPTQHLGSRRRPLPSTYEARFRAVAASKGWPITRFAFPNELVFVVRTQSTSLGQSSRAQTGAVHP